MFRNHELSSTETRKQPALTEKLRSHFLSPVFKQQGPQDICSVLSFDLVRNDHLLHHLVGDARQSLLVQVQQHRTCKQISYL